MMKKVIVLLLAVLWSLPLILAEDTVESSPWVGWRKGYECYDKAGAFREDNDLKKALEYYTRSRDYFAAIKKHFPNWNQSVVEGRIRLCENEMKAVKAQLQSAQSSANTAPQTPAPRHYNQGMPPVHGNNSYEEPRRSAAGPERDYYNRAPGVYDNQRYSPQSNGYGNYSSGGNSGRLYIEMQSEIDQYRQRLRNALAEIDSLQIKLRQSEARGRDIDGVLSDYRLLQEKYSMLEMQYKNARAAADGGNKERYERQLLSLKRAGDEAQKRIRQLEDEAVRKDEDYAISRQEVLKLRDDLQNYANEKRRLQRQLELQKNQLAASGGDAAEKVKTLEQSIKYKDERIARLMEILNSNPGVGTSPASANEIKRLQGEVDALRNAAVESASLQRRINDLLAQEKSLKGQLAESTSLLDLRSKELRALRSSEIKLQQSLTKADSELNFLKMRTAELSRELEQSSSRYSDAVQHRTSRLAADAEHTGKLLNEKRAAEKDLIKAQQDLRSKSSEVEELRKELTAMQELVKSSRTAVIELKSKQHSSEIELKKLAEVQKAYDELKARFDLIERSSGSDVLKTLNRIPGLEESLRRYEKENRSLLGEIAALKKKVPQSSGKTLGDFRNIEIEKVETLLEDARSAEARGNLEIAVWGYRQVLLRDAKNQTALVNLGNIALRRGKFSEGVELLGKAVAAAPADAKLLNAYVRCLIGTREYDKALSKIAEFKKANPKAVKADMLLTEAVAWSRSGKNSDAEKSFKAVLKLQPTNAEAAYELALMLSADEKRRREAGEYYVMAKNNGGAVDSYLEELLRSFSGPDLATRDFLLGNVKEALNKGDMAQSAWYLAEVKKLYPADKEYLFMQNMYDVLNGDPAVVKVLQNAGDDRSRWLYALALRQTKEYDQAAAVLAKTGKLPSNAVIEAVKKFAAVNPDKENKKAQQVTAALLEKLP